MNEIKSLLAGRVYPDGRMDVQAAADYVAVRPEFEVVYQGIQHRLQLRRLQQLSISDGLKSRGLKVDINGILKSDPASGLPINYGYIITATR